MNHPNGLIFLIFSLYDTSWNSLLTNGWTDGRTNRPTDQQTAMCTYRAAIGKNDRWCWRSLKGVGVILKLAKKPKFCQILPKIIGPPKIWSNSTNFSSPPSPYMTIFTKNNLEPNPKLSWKLIHKWRHLGGGVVGGSLKCDQVTSFQNGP